MCSIKQAKTLVPEQSSVHNLSSEQLTSDQIKVLYYESGLNTGDAHTVDFIALLEVTLSKTQTTEDAKNSIRQQVASLIISHRSRRTIPPADVKWTTGQLKVLSHEACSNTTDADSVNLVATVETIFKQTGVDVDIFLLSISSLPSEYLVSASGDHLPREVAFNDWMMQKKASWHFCLRSWSTIELQQFQMLNGCSIHLVNFASSGSR
ncbi:unnamed protein product [Schistocephalus solidus]|uniref:Condensation domain-containing protein n=1 Tax=Schistocephalus solidus TaxID=70667 RepID=A0A183TDW4_SCHSO|nr:unnamed protein product [Schistocephalus solidus]